MATLFPSARNFSASQITIGVLPVPPTVRLPTLMTFLLTVSASAQPARQAKTSRETFIARRRPDGSQSPPPLDPSLRASQPPIGAPSRSFFSYAPDREKVRSRRPRHLPGFPPGWQPPRQRSATQFQQSFPSKGQTPRFCRRQLVPEYCARRRKQAILRQKRRRLVHKATPAHRCCREEER